MSGGRLFTVHNPFPQFCFWTFVTPGIFINRFHLLFPSLPPSLLILVKTRGLLIVDDEEDEEEGRGGGAKSSFSILCVFEGYESLQLHHHH
jgi:hypothetical protein